MRGGLLAHLARFHHATPLAWPPAFGPAVPVQKVASISLQKLCAGSALFFDVRHYKAQEKRFSTLGWSFVPVEVLVDHSSSPSGFGATSRYEATA